MSSKFSQLIEEANKKYLDKGEHPLLLELMQITHKEDNVPYGGNICIYGSDDDSRNEHIPPHFHFFISSEKLENIEINLVTLEPIGMFRYNKVVKHPTKISDTVSKSEFKPYKRFLMGWLPLISQKNNELTNYQMLGFIWNMSNHTLTQVDWKNLKISI